MLNFVGRALFHRKYHNVLLKIVTLIIISAINRVYYSCCSALRMLDPVIVFVKTNVWMSKVSQ